MTDTSVAELSGWTDKKNRRRGLLLLVITAALFVLLFRSIDVRAVVEALRSVPPVTWGVAFLLTCSFPLFSAFRWQATLRAIGHRVPVRRCLTIILGVSPISAIAPSKAGDLLKAISFRGEIGILEVGGTVLAERALDIIVLALFGFAGGLATGHTLIIRLSATIAGAGAVAVFLLPVLVASVRKASLREKLERAIRVFRSLRASPRLAALVLLFTAANWLASIVQTHLLLRAVGATVPFTLTTAVLPTAIFVGLIPLTIGGMGTRDAALVTLLAPAAAAPQALAVGLLYSFFGYWFLALVGLPFLRAALFLPRVRRDGT